MWCAHETQKQYCPYRKLWLINFTWWFHYHLVTFVYKTSDPRYLCQFFFSAGLWVHPGLAVNQVSVRLSSDNAASVTARSFWMSAHVHTCLAHVCVSGLFAIVLYLAFSHPPPPPIITSLCPLFLFCFLSRFLSLPPFLFVLPQLIPCTCCLAPLRCGMEPSWDGHGHAGSIAEKESGRPVTCATSSSSRTVSE